MQQAMICIRKLLLWTMQIPRCFLDAFADLLCIAPKTRLYLREARLSLVPDSSLQFQKEHMDELLLVLASVRALHL